MKTERNAIAFIKNSFSEMKHKEDEIKRVEELESFLYEYGDLYSPLAEMRLSLYNAKTQINRVEKCIESISNILNSKGQNGGVK
jgi:hypothetical protein